MTWKEQQELKRIKASERWLWQPRFYGTDTELVVFPGPYNVGIANLGYQFLLSRLLQLNKSFDRFFIDPRLPSTTSLDTERTLLNYGRWDVTLPFEENLLELIKLLMKLDIPLEASVRDYPVLNAGGAMALINPELVSFIADEVFVGEADEEWPEKRNRAEHKVAKNFGVHSVVTSSQSVFRDTMLVEVARGCMWSCKFCFYRQAYGAIRFVPKERVLNTMATLKEQGFGKVGFVAANVSDVPWFKGILNYGKDLGMRVSVSSLAVETLSQEVIGLLRTLGVQQLTLAVEHGDEKVRKQLGKPFSDEDLINTLKAAEALGYRGVKLYFINGITPNWRFNAESANKLLNDIRKAVKMSIKVSASVFVPKPGTAMKDEAFPSEQLVDMERKMLLSNSAGISFAFEPYWEAQKEFVMSRLSPEDLPTFVSILNEKGERKAIQFFSEKYSN